ncbi:hypothetical protein ADUPG1_010138, partial [Aduncisulcus paluster]
MVWKDRDDIGKKEKEHAESPKTNPYPTDYDRRFWDHPPFVHPCVWGTESVQIDKDVKRSCFSVATLYGYEEMDRRRFLLAFVLNTLYLTFPDKSYYQGFHNIVDHLIDIMCSPEFEGSISLGGGDIFDSWVCERETYPFFSAESTSSTSHQDAHKQPFTHSHGPSLPPSLSSAFQSMYPHHMLSSLPPDILFLTKRLLSHTVVCDDIISDDMILNTDISSYASHPPSPVLEGQTRGTKETRGTKKTKDIQFPTNTFSKGIRVSDLCCVPHGPPIEDDDIIHLEYPLPIFFLAHHCKEYLSGIQCKKEGEHTIGRVREGSLEQQMREKCDRKVMFKEIPLCLLLCCSHILMHTAAPFSTPSLDPTFPFLNSISPILRLESPPLYSILEKSMSTSCLFSLSWIITLFSHDLLGISGVEYAGSCVRGWRVAGESDMSSEELKIGINRKEKRERRERGRDDELGSVIGIRRIPSSWSLSDIKTIVKKSMSTSCLFSLSWIITLFSHDLLGISGVEYAGSCVRGWRVAGESDMSSEELKIGINRKEKRERRERGSDDELGSVIGIRRIPSSWSLSDIKTIVKVLQKKLIFDKQQKEFPKEAWEGVCFVTGRDPDEEWELMKKGRMELVFSLEDYEVTKRHNEEERREEEAEAEKGEEIQDSVSLSSNVETCFLQRQAILSSIALPSYLLPALSHSISLFLFHLSSSHRLLDFVFAMERIGMVYLTAAILCTRLPSSMGYVLRITGQKRTTTTATIVTSSDSTGGLGGHGGRKQHQKKTRVNVSTLSERSPDIINPIVFSVMRDVLKIKEKHMIGSDEKIEQDLIEDRLLVLCSGGQCGHGGFEKEHRRCIGILKDVDPHRSRFYSSNSVIQIPSFPLKTLSTIESTRYRDSVISVPSRSSSVIPHLCSLLSVWMETPLVPSDVLSTFMIHGDVFCCSLLSQYLSSSSCGGTGSGTDSINGGQSYGHDDSKAGQQDLGHGNKRDEISLSIPPSSSSSASSSSSPSSSILHPSLSQLPAFAHLLSTHPFFTLALIPVLLRYTLALYQSYPPHAMFTGDSGVELGIVDPGINNVTLDSDADATVNGVEMGGTSSGRPAGEGLLASSPGLRPGQTKDIDDDRHDQSSGVDLGESTMISSDGDNDPIEMPPKDVVPDVIQDSTGEYDNESDSYGGPSCIPDWKRHVSGV